MASLVSFINQGFVVIGGGVARLGHQLLSEVRGTVYRRSPLATGNLPIVLSERGETAGGDRLRLVGGRSRVHLELMSALSA